MDKRIVCPRCGWKEGDPSPKTKLVQGDDFVIERPNSGGIMFDATANGKRLWAAGTCPVCGEPIGAGLEGM